MGCLICGVASQAGATGAPSGSALCFKGIVAPVCTVLLCMYVGDVELCCSSVMWCVCVQMRCEVSELVALPLGLHRRAHLVCIACMHACMCVHVSRACH